MKSLALFAVIMTNCCLWAQDYPRIELSAGYSYGSVDTQGYGTQRDAQGWSGSLTANLKKWVGVEGEASSRFQTFNFDFQGNPLAIDSRYYTFMVGPRFAHRTGKLTPFVHGLFGLDRSLAYASTVYDPASGTSVTPYVNGLAAVAGGGFDYAISRRLAFRSQADYFFTRQSTTVTPNNFRVMAAIVFTFGQSESISARKSTDATMVAKAAVPVVTAPVPSPSVQPPLIEAAIDHPAIEPHPTAPQTSGLLATAALRPRAVETASETVRLAPPQEVVASAPVEPQMSIRIAPGTSNAFMAKVEPAVAVSPQVTASLPVLPQPVAAPVSIAVPATSMLMSGPNSEIVVQASRQPPPKAEESLGDVARRYREKKRTGTQISAFTGN